MITELIQFYSDFSQAAALLPMWFWLAFVAILGLLVGSFLNVVILRLPPRMMFAWRTEASSILEIDLKPDFVLGEPPPSLVFERSHCPKCGFKLKPWHNIPLISYIALRGKCANCKTPISAQYPIVEALTSVASVACLLKFGPSFACVMALVFTWLLIAMSWIDMHTQLLPDELTQPLLWIGLLLATSSVFVGPVPAIVGAAIGWGSLWSVNFAFKKLRGMDGMGGGDFKLLAGLGAWMGWSMLPIVVLLSATVGAVFGITMVLLRRHERENPMPFGPYLAAAGWIAFVYGDVLMDSYWRLMR
jgi:leader peptidase (prepilin peptidase) / N-methyltransferase